MINWADVRFRYYVAKEGIKPVGLFGREYAVQYLKGWGKHVLSYVLGSGFLVILIFLIKDPARTEVLSSVLRIWSLVLVIDLIISISNFIWPKKEKA
jgi:hypothetical protein